MLHIISADKTYFPGLFNELKALDNVSIQLKKGEFCTIIGSNGAGKSSLLNAVAGGLSLDRGAIEIDCQDITRMPTHKRAAFMGIVFQNPLAGTASGMTVAENLLIAELRSRKSRFVPGLNSQRRKQYRTTLSLLNIGLESRLDSPAEELSGGQRQALALLMAVSNYPKVLLLDEHTASLDPATSDRVMRATLAVVEKYQLTTLMVTHNMQHAIDYGSRLVIMKSGKISQEFSCSQKADLTISRLIERFEIKDNPLPY